MGFLLTPEGLWSTPHHPQSVLSWKSVNNQHVSGRFVHCTGNINRENAESLDVGTFRKCSNDANIHMYCRLSQAHSVLNSLCYDDGMPSIIVEAASGRQ